MRDTILLLAALGLVGCKGEPPAAPKTEPSAAAPEAPGEADGPATPEPAAKSPKEAMPAAVELLEAGREPRRTLQPRIAPGRKHTLRVEVENQIDALIGILQGRQVPRSVTFTLAVRTLEEATGEPRTFSFRVNAARTVYAKDLPERARKSREAALATIKGLEGSYQIDSLGMVREVTMNLPSDASGDLAGIATDLEWALRRVGTPFPNEPIGRGATWTVSRRVEQDGVDASELATVEVTKLQPKRVTVKIAVKQGADPQTIINPGAFAHAELVVFTGEEAGKITWKPNEAFPRSAKISSTVTKETNHQAEGKLVNSVIVTTRTLTIDGRKR